jgi:DNA-binding GntR family transcriptional regulator
MSLSTEAVIAERSNSMIPLTGRMPSVVELEPEVSPPVALPDRIYGTLKHRILTCSMLPGQRIVEKDLCKEMQVSRTPLREAFNRLALEGLIVLSPYRGYAVSPVTVEGYQELCELRRIVEAGTAALAAERATEEDVNGLLSRAETRYTPGDRATYEGYLRANSVFHLALVRCTRNRQLEGIVMSALDRHQRPLYLGLDVGIDGRASTNEHLEIIDAVRNRQADRARQLMVDHIAKAEGRIVSALRAAGY